MWTAIRGDDPGQLSSDSFDELEVSPDLSAEELRRIALRVADALSD